MEYCAAFSYCAIPIVLLALGFIVGKAIEYAHFRELKKWEMVIRDEILITNLEKVPDDLEVERSFLCSGSVVIAGDYFKSFVAGLKNLIGGRIGAYETLLTRARREALVRTAHEAYMAGAKVLMNIRFETANIDQGKGIPMVEVLAYATALVLKPGSKFPGYDPQSPLTPVE